MGFTLVRNNPILHAEKTQEQDYRSFQSKLSLSSKIRTQSTGKVKFHRLDGEEFGCRILVQGGTGNRLDNPSAVQLNVGLAGTCVGVGEMQQEAIDIEARLPTENADWSQ